MAQLRLRCLKKTCARARPPLPRLSRWCAGGNVPCGRESAKVIQADNVNVIEQSTQTVYAPPITGRAKGVPVINWIAPQLPLSAEIIGRNSGDETWATLLV